MDHQKPTLIMIPGLGDRVKWYRKLSPLWNWLGYNTQIFSFDWENPAKDFTESFSELLREIDNQNTPIYIIGASAGGSAAVNALYARPGTVKKVVTVAATFKYQTHLDSLKLKDSINHLFSHDNSPPIDRILSVYGLYDQKVPISSTRRLKAPGRRIFMIGHGAIIVTALTICAYSISRFFRS